MSHEREPDPVQRSAAERIRALADRYVERYFAAFPDAATMSGRAAGDHDRLPDISLDARDRWRAEEDAILAELDAVEAASLPEGDPARVTAAVLREVLEASREYRIGNGELWSTSPTFNGWLGRMATLAGAQPLATAGDEEAALRRFGELPRYVGQEIENAREGVRLGYTAPRSNVLAALRQLEAYLAAPVEASPFVAMGRERGPAFRQRLVELETTRIRPAVARYRDFLRDEYLAHAREAIGISALPDGERAYRAAIRYHASVDMAPEEVHRLGLEQVERIRTEMRELARSEFGTDDVGGLLQRLRTEPAWLFSSREDLLRAAGEAVERARAAAPRWFGRLPASDVVVTPVPAFAEETAPPAFYRAPAEDGSRPGMYYINLHEAERQPRTGLESTTFHEAIPGHHLQIALALERRELHPISRYFFLSGFTEGWALYAERLADEMGLFTSPVDRMGMLNNEAFRAVRLVVDTGIHVLGWSRERAIEYLLANTVEPPPTAASEVDRYIAVPGQATSYMIGALEIARLRERAERQLGARFDLRAFHDVLLEDGSVPLGFLREAVERWIEARLRDGT